MSEIWPLLVGQIFAERSRVVDYREETLFVEAEDQAWEEALEQQKAEIICNINRLLPDSLRSIHSLTFSVSAQLFSMPSKKPKVRTDETIYPLSDQEMSVIQDPELKALVARVVGRHRGLKKNE